MSKIIPTVTEAVNQLNESIKDKMDERVVKIIKDSIQASIDYGTDEVTFTLPFKSDKDLVVSYLAIFKYTATFESNPDGSILFKFLIKLSE